MSEKEVKYTLSLNDMLTGKIKQADQATQSLHGSLGHAKEMLLGVGAALGVGFGLMKIEQFVDKSREKFHELHMAEVQLANTLSNVGERAGITGEQMIGMAEDFAHTLPYTQAQFVNMEGELSRFKNINESTFKSAVTMSADLATALHRDSTQVASSLGRILEAPAENGRLLRQFHLSLTADQLKLLKVMERTGHTADAQRFIFEKLAEKGYGGAAKAAADADPLFRYHKIIEEIQLGVGRLTMKFQTALAPLLEKVANGFKSSLEWMREHKDLLEAIAIGVGVAVGVYGVYAIAVNAVSMATKIWTGVQWLLNAAMDANPIGLVIVAIGAATAAVVYCYKHFATFRAVLMGVWETIKEFGRIVADIFGGLWHVIHGVFTFSATEIKQGLGQQMSAMGDAGARLGGAFKKGFDDGMADFAKDHADEVAGPKAIVKKGVIKGDSGKDGKAETAKATGNKSINISIKIDSLIKQFSVNTKNIQEGTQKIKELVIQTLLSAVNDSQITAGQ